MVIITDIALLLLVDYQTATSHHQAPATFSPSPTPSRQQMAPVTMQHRPGDKPIPHRIQIRLRHILRQPNRPRQTVTPIVLDPRLGHPPLQQLRVHGARRDAIHADGSHVDGEAARGALDRAAHAGQDGPAGAGFGAVDAAGEGDGGGV